MKEIKKIAALQKGRVKSSVPVLDYLRFWVSGENKITVMFTNAELSVEKVFSVESTSKTGDLLFPIKLLKAIKNIKKDSQYTFEVLDNQQVLFTSDGIKQTVQSIYPEHYPQFPKDKYTKMMAVNNDFLSKLEAASLSTSQSETRPVLTSILIHETDYIISTDSHRLYKADIKGRLNEGDILIATPLVQAISSLEKSTNFFGIMHMGHNHVLVETLTTRLCHRTTDGNYPATDRLIPNNFNIDFEVKNLKQFKKTLETCNNLMKDSKNNVVTFTIINDDTLEILARMTESSEEIRTTIEILPGKVEENFKISLSSAFILDSIKQLDSQSLTFKIHSPMRPMIVHGNNENIISLILPVRTY